MFLFVKSTRVFRLFFVFEMIWVAETPCMLCHVFHSPETPVKYCQLFHCLSHVDVATLSVIDNKKNAAAPGPPHPAVTADPRRLYAGDGTRGSYEEEGATAHPSPLPSLPHPPDCEHAVDVDDDDSGGPGANGDGHDTVARAAATITQRRRSEEPRQPRQQHGSRDYLLAHAADVAG